MPTPKKHASHADRQRAYVQRQKTARLAELAAKNMPAAAPIPTMPSMARWKALRDQAQAILQTLQDEMETYRDDRSEAWQEGEKGEAFQEIIDSVAAALESAEGIEL
jgi:TRAP-type C4-dicarboxylate transport system substrate-binding protein